jgi:GST-like protein
VLEERLAKSAYLGGPEYSIADIATIPWTTNHNIHGVRFEDHPNLERWSNAIAKRPAVQRALKKVEAIKSSRETATDDDKDRFFGRGRYARA